ncbi:uncharacterized protein MKK02DRAFT_40720 [Dioszegia hungarica]|uniref:Uncharacterized protein n=1 Tax=Dioszegia hungarica TaxID=4972 RepID=A0AA38H0Y2_9TREE|nr:uncharacterized protein MKK02DRAFT_40720 [Dioszegia hungarica]KAI9632418.1 hypothetical protein MKK02DRAFT_40720 [Dioszegia hungarica]
MSSHRSYTLLRSPGTVIMPLVRSRPVFAGGVFLASTVLFALVFFADAAAEQLSTISSALPSIKYNTCPSSCPPDPYAQHGMVHYSASGAYNETRWVPFPEQNEEAQMAMAAKGGNAADWKYGRISGLPLTDEIPEEAWDIAPRDWTMQLRKWGLENQALLEAEAEAAKAAGAGTGAVEGVEGGTAEVALMELGTEWDWARGKLVVFIGSSHDRNNVWQWCDEVIGEYTSWGGHIGGFCHIEALDLTIAHWFLYGLIDDESLAKIRSAEGRPLTYELRIKDVMRPLMVEHGIDRKPDLMVVTSLFWDEGAIEEYGVHYSHRVRKAPAFAYNELAWHRSRFRQLITHLREMYSPSMPMMVRTRHIRLITGWWLQLKIQQLDQGCRAVARGLGVREFTWGDKLEGYNQFSDGDQHYDYGPTTYIFGE